MHCHETAESTVSSAYTGFNTATDSPEVLPLLYCLERMTLTEPPAQWLARLLPSWMAHFVAGDSGWEITNMTDSGELRRDESGRVMYRAWTDQDASGLRPCEGEYDEATIRLHIYRALTNFALAHPERQEEVDEIIGRSLVTPITEQV